MRKIYVPPFSVSGLKKGRPLVKKKVVPCKLFKRSDNELASLVYGVDDNSLLDHSDDEYYDVLLHDG